MSGHHAPDHPPPPDRGEYSGVSHDGLIRAVMALFRRMDIAAAAEMRLGRSGRRCDVFGLDRKGRISIVEVKASKADFQADQKWQDYLEYCDAFYFAVAPDFPADQIPEDCGLIIGDGFDADVLRHDSLGLTLNAARRRSITLDVARVMSFRSTA